MRRTTALCAAAAAAASAEPLSWESHGELMDEVELAKPAISDEQIRGVNGDPAATWVAGRNARFEGMTLRQAKALMGEKQNTDRSSWLAHRPLKPVTIPDEFDWRTDPRAAKCPSVKEIRDQANCGSCWAFGAVEAITDRFCIASGGAKSVHISAQDAFTCVKKGTFNHAGGGDDGCGGGFVSHPYIYMNTTGLVSGGNYGDTSGCLSYQLPPCAHHTNSTTYPACPKTIVGYGKFKCVSQCADNPSLQFDDDRHFMRAPYAVCAQGSASGANASACAGAMAQEIYQNGPISFGFTVYQSFTSYKSGVYQKKAGSDPQLGGHAIKLLGYGNENGVPYWLVANSWNEEWGGLGGFFKIRRASNECGIESPGMNGGPVAGEPVWGPPSPPAPPPGPAPGPSPSPWSFSCRSFAGSKQCITGIDGKYDTKEACVKACR